MPVSLMEGDSAPDRSDLKKMITDYEAGRISAYAEWVAWGGKPIAEVGARNIASEDLPAFASELQTLLSSLSLPISGFLLEVERGQWALGVYRHAYALEALLETRKRCPDWVMGHLFGYNSDAVSGYVSASSPSPESTSQHADASDTVEIVPLG